MSTRTLAIVALVLAGAMALASKNPTKADYERYQDQLIDQTIERLAQSSGVAKGGVLEQLARSKQGTFLKSVIRSQTTHRSYGLFTVFQSKLFSSRFIVLGIGGHFIPLTDPEEVLRDIEKSAITPSRTGSP